MEWTARHCTVFYRTMRNNIPSRALHARFNDSFSTELWNVVILLGDRRLEDEIVDTELLLLAWFDKK